MKISYIACGQLHSAAITGFTRSNLMLFFLLTVLYQNLTKFTRGDGVREGASVMVMLDTNSSLVLLLLFKEKILFALPLAGNTHLLLNVCRKVIVKLLAL